MARVDVSILKEIARIIQSRARVPDRIQVQKRTFLITYLDDHKQRIEEALRRHDPDRLNMLFGQLESKVKYQLVRRSPAAAGGQPSKRSARSSSAPSKRRPARADATTQTRPRPKPVPKLSTKRTTGKADRKKKRKEAVKPPARKTARRHRGR